MMKKMSLEPPATISETIYRYLKKAIIEGELKPRQKVPEKEIAKLFNVSTTPTREAFQRLSAEKYLTIDARREVFVTAVTPEEILEIFEVVRVLDALASRKALENLTKADIDELKEMTGELRDLYDRKKIDLYVKQNLKIHYRIWKACGNNFLYQSLFNLGEKFTFFSNQLFALIDNPSFNEKSLQDHLDLVKAIERKDAESVEKILIVHWGGVGFLDRKEPETLKSK
jgi:DNA-binding GntR family transcriptional regulator